MTEGVPPEGDVVGTSPPTLLVAGLATELAAELGRAEVLEGEVLAVKAQLPHEVGD